MDDLVFRGPDCPGCGTETDTDGTSWWCGGCGATWDDNGENGAQRYAERLMNLHLSLT